MSVKKSIALIEVPQSITEEQQKRLRKSAEKRLGPGYRVMVMSGGITCKIVPALK